MNDWDLGVGDASRSIADFVLRKGLALPPWAQIIVIGVWIAVGATLVGTVLRILGSLLGE